MKQLTITYVHIQQSITVDDDEKANAAYAKLKEAMDEYKEYGNDKHRSVEIDLGSSGMQNITVGAIAAVVLCDMTAVEDTLVKKEVWARRLDARVTSALQPAAA